MILLQKLTDTAPPSFKFNPYHDDLGRFTFGPDGGGDDGSNEGDANNGDDDTPDAAPNDGDMRYVQEVFPADIIFGRIPPTIDPPFEEFPTDQTKPPAPGG